MKRNLLKIYAIALLAFTMGYAKAQIFTYPVKGEKGFSLTKKTRGNVTISYNLGEFSFNNLNYKGEDMTEIELEGIFLLYLEYLDRQRTHRKPEKDTS